MSSNDFLEFDDDNQTQESSSGRSPFGILAVVLVVILILASIFTVNLLNNRNQNVGQQEATAIAITTLNAITQATNIPVTETIAAMQAEASRPPTETATPTPAIIDEPTETPTVSPTDTATAASEVVAGEEGAAEGEEGVGEEGATGEAVVNAEGEEAGGSETGTTEEDTAVVGNTPVPSFDSTGSNNALPQTGLDTWTAVLLAAFFIGLVIAARRLRSS